MKCRADLSFVYYVLGLLAKASDQDERELTNVIHRLQENDNGRGVTE